MIVIFIPLAAYLTYVGEVASYGRCVAQVKKILKRDGLCAATRSADVSTSDE